ncbi:DUF4190 domain-containing protein [Nocardioides sp. zg-DK7169]|uniref:DUF4190 domain-containing protein n=1 Tax=Nocardioides sp. zg-DK7169 TaxID=2736600 RepID=UPI001556D88D|nr:DUF4190 domain-containing protein [Nocardioides sp. zg-DK7169]NPC97715.1 hypothetical protein [Nocardioides sp. zg-DK7169]
MTQPPQYPDPYEPGDPSPSAPPPGPPTSPWAQPSGQSHDQQPSPPPYGENPYAQAPPPYGQPPFGQGPGSPYGSAYPGGPPQQSAPQGMAITSLVLAFLGCLVVPAIVSIVLAVIVLRRGRDGRNHGKGLAIGAIVVSGLTLLATIAVGALLAIGIALSEDVNDLETGDCIDAPSLADDDEEFTSIETVSCEEPHDGEVLGTVVLDAEQAELYASSPFAGARWCAEATGFSRPVDGTGLSLMRLTNSAEPEAGDTLACVVYDADGDKLDAPIR